MGGVSKGKVVLVHAAASGVGCAAIQLCKQIGAITIASSSTSDKLDFLKTLGADYTINYKENPDFSSLALEYTNNKGVDIILDCIGAQNFEYNIKSAAIDCHWVFYGSMGGTIVSEFNLGKLLLKRISFLSSTLKSRTNQYKANLVSSFTKDFLHLFETGELKPIIDTVYKFSEMPLAHERMESNQNIGKIVCTNDM